MLKITDVPNRAHGEGGLKLEGQIIGRWVDELRRAYFEKRRDAIAPLTLDLRDVTFIDHAGLAFFGEISGEIILINCSLFAAEQLKAVTERRDAVRR